MSFDLDFGTNSSQRKLVTVVIKQEDENVSKKMEFRTPDRASTRYR